MIFENTWRFARTHLALTVFILVAFAVINYFMIISISPFAPGYPILIGFIGGTLGALAATIFAPQSTAVSNGISESIESILKAL